MLTVDAHPLLDLQAFIFFTVAALLATAGMLTIRYQVLRIDQYGPGVLGDFFIFGTTCATAGEPLPSAS